MRKRYNHAVKFRASGIRTEWLKKLHGQTRHVINKREQMFVLAVQKGILR